MSKVRQRIVGGYTFLSALFSCILFGIIPVQAASTANAVSDIMNSDRFTGAIESIEWLTTRVDHWFTMIITATAFFIISAAMLKNTCAGAYCANPKFWNKVAEAHEKAEAVQLSSLFQGEFKQKFANLSTSSIKDAILCIVPNIKAFTEFDDADIEPKQYFMKAIPQMCACIIVGVFIYNGYYRDTAAVVGNFGSEICTRFFGSIDAANWVDKLTQTTSKAESVFDNDESLEGRYCKEITQALYKAYIGVSKNVTTKEEKASLMRDCEAKAKSVVNNKGTTDNPHTSIVEELCGDPSQRDWDYSIGNVHLTLVPKSAVNDEDNLHRNDLDPDTHTKYSYYGYFSKPNYASCGDSQAYFYISFVMNGSSKTATAGKSLIDVVGAQASSAEPLSLSVNIPVSKTKDKVTFNLPTLRNVIAESVRKHADEQYDKVFKSNDITITTDMLSYTTIDGSGNSPSYNLSNDCKLDITVHINPGVSGNRMSFDLYLTLKAANSGTSMSLVE